MSVYLTPEELFRLTGYKQRARQRQWLRAREWAYEVTAQGEIRVLRAYRDQRLGVAGIAKTIENASAAGFNAFYFQKPSERAPVPRSASGSGQASDDPMDQPDRDQHIDRA